MTSTRDVASIGSRAEFQDQVRALIGQAEAEGAQALWWIDPDFADWPLNERALIQALTAWARPQRRLTMLASRYEELQRVHPRFVQWRRDFGHLMACRQADVDVSELPTLLMVGPATGLQLIDRQRFRGRLLRDRAEGVAWHEAIDALMQRSQDGFASTMLGL